MFFTYLRRELRRRARQTVAVALGLALGIALVIGASSASAGIKSAQSTVLKSLYGVGTDITVSKTATRGSGRPQSFGASGKGQGRTRISQDALHASPGSATLTTSQLAKVSSVSGVKEAVGVLSLTDTDFSGSVTQKGSASSRSSSASTTRQGAPSGGSTGGPPSFNGSFNLNSFTVDGVTVTSTDVGPVSSSQITSGRYFTSTENDSKVAIVNTSYAKQHSLTVGSTVKVASKKLTVIGLTTSSTANVYIPLGTAQALAKLTGEVTSIDVSATSSGVVTTVAKAIRAAVPTTTVTAASSLAASISGSLSSASSLVSKLGKGISIGGLIMAILVAGLMMSSAISRRIREIGTLKAIGWRTRRIVAQVLGEGLVIGLVGAVAGVVLGIGIASLITALSPSLTASVGASSAATAIGGGFGAAGSAASKVLVHLTAPLQAGAILLAIGLAILGGLMAGGAGAWRAARLRPADALRRLE